MANNHETGHAKNVANLAILISFINRYGATYNPSNDTITITALNNVKSGAELALQAVNNIKAAIEISLSARKMVFEPLGKFITRLINALKAASPSAHIIENATTLVRKLQGRRASAKLTNEEKELMKAEGVEVKQISSSQMSFDSRIENLSKLISLLTTVPEYSPNEEEFSIASLNSRLEDLRTKNQAVVEGNTELSNALIARNEMMYKENTGLVDRALTVKQYVKSIFGATSPQYKQISGLEFKKYKI